MHTPYFPAFRPRLAPMGGRAAQAVRQTTLGQLQEQLRDLLPVQIGSATDEGPNSRDRVFNLRLTLECFLWQMLKPRTACREVVRQVQSLLCLQGGGEIDDGDSAYIQARLRLPKERLEQALAATAQAADRRVAPLPQLQGRPVKVVDCSTLPLADTAANQTAYPQPRSQKPGCGFPLLKLLGLFSLASGALLEVATDVWQTHDLRLLRQVWESLKKGDIMLGDRAYGDYVTLAAGPRQRGVDVVARLHQGRKVDFRKARRLAQNDGLFTWTKGGQQSTVLTAQEWRDLPAEITVRVLRFTATIRGRRARRISLVTTLLDPELYPARELIALYLRRWRLELCFRDVKTTLGLEALRCHSPAMAQKELLAGLTAHNLIRCVMAEAAATYEVPLDQLSFKGAVDALRVYSATSAHACSRKKRRDLWGDLLLQLARDLVRRRPNRREPRAVKRRPKAYPLLNRPRHQFVEIPHRHKYHKARP